MKINQNTPMPAPSVARPTPSIQLQRLSAIQDVIATQGSSLLAGKLSADKIRPDVIARAREIATDPNYPPPQMIRRIAEKILSSCDLSASG